MLPALPRLLGELREKNIAHKEEGGALSCEGFMRGGIGPQVSLRLRKGGVGYMPRCAMSYSPFSPVPERANGSELEKAECFGKPCPSGVDQATGMGTNQIAATPIC